MTEARTEPGSTPAGDIAHEQGLAFAATLAARLCHDLAGTMGALTGMLDMAAEGEPEALDLAAACARELSGKLRLLRAAWSAEGELPELSSVLAGLPGAERLTVELSGGTAAMDDAARRLAVNLLLVAAGALPRGGTIRLAANDEGFSVEIDGARAAWPAALERCAADPVFLRAACTRSRDVGVAVACLVAGQAGLSLTVHSPTRLTVGQ